MSIVVHSTGLWLNSVERCLVEFAIKALGVGLRVCNDDATSESRFNSVEDEELELLT